MLIYGAWLALRSRLNSTEPKRVPPRPISIQQKGALHERERTRHHRADPRLLGHSAQLGGLDRVLREQGLHVLAPAYPGFEVEVEALNADPSPIEVLQVPEIIEHLEAVVGDLEAPPILMGHSAGGVFTQILLDLGFGAPVSPSTRRRPRE